MITIVINPRKTMKFSNPNYLATGAVASAIWEIIDLITGEIVATYTSAGGSPTVTSIADGQCIAYHLFTEANGGNTYQGKLAVVRSNGWESTELTYEIYVNYVPEAVP